MNPRGLSPGRLDPRRSSPGRHGAGRLRIARAPTIGISIAVPEPYAGELAAWRKDFGDPLADRVPPHITLLPPSVLARRRSGAARRHLRRQAAATQAFDVHLRGTATFRPTSPVVFVALSRGISECELLQAGIRSGPLQRDLAFPYHPHVTVAHDVHEADLDRAELTLRDWEATFTVRGFSLYEHGADGVWRPREDFTFPDA